jgi:hypothetical protein
MHSACLATPIPLSRPLPLRWWNALVDAWHGAQARQHHNADVAAMAELSERVLRDIGAPDELLLEAQARRDADYLRASELRLGMGRGAF